jgi:hypothetical protein
MRKKSGRGSDSPGTGPNLGAQPAFRLMGEGCRTPTFLLHLHLQMFKLLARAYADVHPMMMDRSENRCGGNFLKRGSIINGADWYSFTGGAA